MQAQAEREASAGCIARLEEAVLAMAFKRETVSTATSNKPGKLDLQRFRISDGPTFSGPFQAFDPFIKWIRGIQIFFDAKSVTEDGDKVRIAGALIRETNLLSFYSNSATTFNDLGPFSTSDVRFRASSVVANYTSPGGLTVKMSDTETFLAFSGRAQTLQSLVNLTSPFCPTWI